MQCKLNGFSNLTNCFVFVSLKILLLFIYMFFYYILIIIDIYEATSIYDVC